MVASFSVRVGVDLACRLQILLRCASKKYCSSSFRAASASQTVMRSRYVSENDRTRRHSVDAHKKSKRGLPGRRLHGTYHGEKEREREIEMHVCDMCI